MRKGPLSSNGFECYALTGIELCPILHLSRADPHTGKPGELREEDGITYREHIAKGKN